MGKARNLANLQPSADGQIETNDIQDLAVTPAKMSQKLTSGTAVASTSGTAIDFTNIPSWAKRITVMFAGVSTSGSSNYLVQVGAGSVTTSGYLGASTLALSSVGTVNFTTGFELRQGGVGGGVVFHGTMTISLINANTWVASGVTGMSQSAMMMFSGGSVALSGTLDRVRITTVNGTDTFDAGTINIMWE